MRRGIIISLLILLATVGIVSAEEGVSITEINSTTILQPGELGEYILLIENQGTTELKLQIQAEPYVGLPSNDFDYVFVDPNYVVLEGHESVEVTITLKLKEDVLRQKRYKSYVTLTSVNVDTVSTQYDLQVFAMPPQDAVTVTLSDLTDRVGPGGEIPLSVHIVNNLPQDLNNIDVYLSSELFNDKQTVELFEGQEKDLDFVFPIAKTAAAGEYTFSARIYYDGELSGSAEGSFIVDENLNTSSYTETEKGFLYTIETVTITNNGNSEISDFYDEDPEMFESWFTSYSLDANYDDELGNPTWTFTLAPEEEFVLVIKTDYRPLLVGVIVLILLGFIAYYLFIKRVTVRKETFKLKYSTDGVSEFKVLLHLKNNTNKPIKDISVVDVLPKLIQPKTNFGTLHPSGIERGDKGIRMMWKIPELVSGEERIISYEVDAQFKVIGDISLPNATVKFKNKGNRVIQIRSNSAKVVSGIVAEEISPGDRPARKR
ncbi:hypothetical protein EXS74_03190 [Candidatus Woesearchaeota archaeon]|nr:hypothetical protein [Candidatus Woesearchaeota archaeon]